MSDSPSLLEPEEALRRQEHLTAELSAMRQLQETSTQLIQENDPDALYRQIVDAAAAVMRSDSSSLQMLHPERGAMGELRLLACRGIDPQATEGWEWVSASLKTSCGAALRERRRVVISDVRADADMAGTAELAASLKSGVLATQSTPLVSRDGRILGMISTHWHQVHQPSERDLRLLDVLSRQAADLIERSQAEAALRESEKKLRDFASDLELQVARRTLELTVSNQELEAFCYSVSHDLRAPLRGIASFTQLLRRRIEPGLDPEARGYLQRIEDASRQMSKLITDMLELSRVTQREMRREKVDLGLAAWSIMEQLSKFQPDRRLEFRCADGLTVEGGPLLLRLVLQNLLENAWKFTGKKDRAVIEFGFTAPMTFFVKDNGAGFDMAHADQLFGVFQRLHKQEDFPGTGVGLVATQRIIQRHGGEIWAEAKVDEGACFYFTLPSRSLKTAP